MAMSLRENDNCHIFGPNPRKSRNQIRSPFRACLTGESPEVIDRLVWAWPGSWRWCAAQSPKSKKPRQLCPEQSTCNLQRTSCRTGLFKGDCKANSTCLNLTTKKNYAGLLYLKLKVWEILPSALILWSNGLVKRWQVIAEQLVWDSEHSLWIGKTWSLWPGFFKKNCHRLDQKVSTCTGSPRTPCLNVANHRFSIAGARMAVLLKAPPSTAVTQHWKWGTRGV